LFFKHIVGMTKPHTVISHLGLGRVTSSSTEAKAGDDRREVSRHS
jgi:hypothetical protein